MCAWRRRRRRARTWRPRPAPDRATWVTDPAKVFDNLYFVGTKIHSAWALTTSEGIILIDTLYDLCLEDAIVGGLKKLGLDPAKRQICHRQPCRMAIMWAGPSSCRIVSARDW